MSDAAVSYPTYESLGVRPLINCRGSYTIISGSVILPEVREAMVEASRRYVHLDELMDAVGARIAMEVVREAQSSAESLVAFAPEANRRARDTVSAPRMTFALAA